MKKLIQLLVMASLMHEWAVKPDGSPKEANDLEDNILYYWQGVVWKFTHPVTAVCSKDGEARAWLKRVRGWMMLIARPC